MAKRYFRNITIVLQPLTAQSLSFSPHFWILNLCVFVFALSISKETIYGATSVPCSLISFVSFFGTRLQGGDHKFSFGGNRFYKKWNMKVFELFAFIYHLSQYDVQLFFKKKCCWCRQRFYEAQGRCRILFRGGWAKSHLIRQKSKTLLSM